MTHSIDDAIAELSTFYEICESFFTWRAKKYGEFHCLTFSDTCYVEIYGDSPRTSVIVEDIIELVGQLESKKSVPRAFLSKGFTYRRKSNLLQKSKGVIHSFGLGNAMIKVFEAERSHLKGTLFVEDSLYDAILKTMFPSLGVSLTVDRSIAFVRLR